MKRLLITLLAALSLLLPASAASLVLPAAAQAKRDPGLFGVVMTPDLAATSPSVLNSQMALMARSGVHWLRTGFDWETAEPAPGSYNWSQIDVLARTAAAHRLHLLPVVEFTPRWASSHPSSAWNEYSPSNDAYFAQFMTALVQRYGPHGQFWKTPGVRYLPITAWQIWNEPEGTNYDWRSAPWPKTYTALLKAGYVAVHHADRHATVVSGALVALKCQGCLPWTEAASLYKAGFKHYFDALAINTFTINPTSVSGTIDFSLTIVSRVRQVLRRYHDLRKPIWVTELTWPASLHRINPKYYDGFETTPAGQAKRLTAYYTRLATRHPDNIQRAFWFAWTSPYVPYPVLNGDVTFQYTGLLKWKPGDAVFQPLPLLKTYARVAHRYG